MQELHYAPGFRYATEQDDLFTETCIDIVYETLEKWAVNASEITYSGDAELHLHRKMWDLLAREKSGRRKEHDFVDLCRRVASHTKTSTATDCCSGHHCYRACCIVSFLPITGTGYAYK